VFKTINDFMNHKQNLFFGALRHLYYNRRGAKSFFLPMVVSDFLKEGGGGNPPNFQSRHWFSNFLCICILHCLIFPDLSSAGVIQYLSIYLSCFLYTYIYLYIQAVVVPEQLMHPLPDNSVMYRSKHEYSKITWLN